MANCSPAAVCGKDGTPLLSWRVLILPFIEEDSLFKEFKLDEPWDSPHNIRLLPRMPRSYRPPGHKAELVPPHHTVIHVFVGYGAAFEWADGKKLRADFPDGVSNTLLLIEAGKPVPWTKPEEPTYAPGRPLPDLDRIFRDGFRVCMGDASRSWISKDMSETTLRPLITRNGHDKVGADG